MSVPFMQLYVADYLGDTRHLTTEQHGAYLLLLMAMWRAGGSLPDDAAKLARMAGLSASRWQKTCSDVMAFFDVEDGKVTQKRLVNEIRKATEKSQKRSESGALGGNAKALKNKEAGIANATALPQHSSDVRYQTPEQKKKDNGADAPNVIDFSGGKYEFEGETVKVTAATMAQFRKDFRWLTDLVGTLKVIDAYYTHEKPLPAGKGWYFPALRWLQRENEEARLRRREETRGVEWG